MGKKVDISGQMLYKGRFSQTGAERMRILGLDYGSRRIGVAVCDELGMTARGVTTIVRRNREADLGAIDALAKRHGVERIVIGYPLRLDGSEGIQCEKINRFIRRLETRLALPVIRWDETLSTSEAQELLRQGGVRGEKRRAIVDRVAASIILQGYLDANAPGGDRDDNVKDR